MVDTTTIHVLAFGEAFKLVFNMIVAFTKGGVFLSGLKLSALFGIVTTTVAYIKGHDPMVYAKWVFIYTAATTLILVPKTTVSIDDMTASKPYVVKNVPYFIGFTVGLVTNFGYSLTKSYESLLSGTESQTYSQTGMLFGSKLLQASHQFHIVDTALKNDMDKFFRNCVVGDIKINNKYSMAELNESNNVFNLVTKQASPVRRIKLFNGVNYSCREAVSDKKVGLKVRLKAEVNNAYEFYGKQIFPKPAKESSYEKMFETHLKDASEYYQGTTDSSANIVLQNLMINAMNSGMSSYGAKTESSAAILNKQFSKTQLQQRSAWNIGIEKAIWFLPLLHTVLLVICISISPIVLLFSSFPGGLRILKSYIKFLISIELWPVLFSVTNALVIMYGHTKTGQYGVVTSVTVDSLDQVHEDLAGVAGSMMIMIPFLAKGFVSDIGEAFSGLATSLTASVQNSTMAAAGEVSSASFALGNNSFHNSTANTLSANKHDSNFTNLHGLSTEQTKSGTTITETGAGQRVYNSSAALSNSSIGVGSSKGLQDILTHSKERAEASASIESAGLNKSLASAGHSAYQFNNTSGHDVRLGHGASSSDSVQAQKAMSHAWQTAEDVAKRNGISTEEAFSGLTRHTYTAQAGVDTKGNLWGKAANLTTGASGSVSTSHGYDNSHSGTNRNSSSTDLNISSREEESFKNDLSTISSFTKNHHLDTSGSQSENLLFQVGTDLRESQMHSDALNTSLTGVPR